MEDTAVVAIRMPKLLKEESSDFFRSCGMSLSQGIQLFLRQCLNRNELPFSVIPDRELNYETAAALKEAEKGIGCSKAYEDVDEFLRDLYA
ncbi:MAG: type II toxin-antitoxin system RelB/DinJ family antitoxin [Acidaminococcaceae bacterium]|nr:type II toxin-antitoxin system RelB/DinJ family antitoxin [Acidaminococcaceae bacterium]